MNMGEAIWGTRDSGKHAGWFLCAVGNCSSTIHLSVMLETVQISCANH